MTQPNQHSPNDGERYIGAPGPNYNQYPSNGQVPEELAGGSEVNKSGWKPVRALIAVLIAFAMVAAGVIVSVAVLRGPEVKADAPLDPATPAGQGGGATPSPGPTEPVEAPELDGATFIIPATNAKGELLLEVTGVGRYDPNTGDGVYGYYPWGTGDLEHTVIEATLTNNADDDVRITEEFQSFVQTSDDMYFRSENLSDRDDPYMYLRPEPGESVEVVIVFPTLAGAEPEFLGVVVGSNWYDSATWLDLDGIPAVTFDGDDGDGDDN